MEENENPVQLINGEMIDISRLSSEEADKLLKKVEDEILEVQNQIDEILFNDSDFDLEGGEWSWNVRILVNYWQN